MKTTITALLLLGIAGIASADQYVQGHVRKDGTYVQGYHRSSPDSSTLNNYSTQGNYNPYTGKQGTESAYSTPSYGSSSSSSSSRRADCYYNCKD